MKEAESQHGKEKNNRHERRKNVPQFVSDLQSTLYGQGILLLLHAKGTITYVSGER